MRMYDNGAFFTVLCSRADVKRFRQRWPCFGPVRPVAFEFDRGSGDFVGLRGNTRDMDDAGIAALSRDAQAFGAARLGLPARPA